MALTPHTRIGVDEIVEPIFEGEMRQEYRPTDTKLKRQIAMTTLPSSSAAQAGQLAPIQPGVEVLAGLRLESIYASLPTLVCQGLCAESCGPIACSQTEADHLEAAAGRPLEFTSGLTCGYLDPLERRCKAVLVPRCSRWDSARPLVYAARGENIAAIRSFSENGANRSARTS